MFAPTEHATATEAPATRGDDQMLTPAAIVALLGGSVTERRVRGWISRGVLVGTNPARGVWLVQRSDFDDWLAAGRRVQAPRAPRPRRTPVPERIQPTRGQLGSRRGRRTTELKLG